MKTEMVLSFQNLQDGKQIETVMDEIDGLSYEKIESKGFDGVELVIYILSIGGGVVITQLANIIINLIRKNDNLRVKIGDIELTGYPAEAIPGMLDSAVEYFRKRSASEENDS